MCQRSTDTDKHYNGLDYNSRYTGKKYLKTNRVTILTQLELIMNKNKHILIVIQAFTV